ncbi:type IV pilin protein [Alteromonas sp. 1_MG-2023]|uniref:type IV pilin protein n=1 Tax=Alteromonas sp. 1_MG-2023 TaxID=3062669 RepID=UPI0026E2D60C|nr:type IV pilin protein [Alteromonas sp. 1_MG-2023]MDO6566204.1 type IV pilin protein [Alteromonas sp. 1_MG-2023]
MNSKKSNGFSLIELMIVVAIVGILAAIAYPSYQSFMTDGYRGSAQADMLAFAAAMERHHSGSFSYKGAGPSGGDTGAPTIFASYSPAAESAANKRYDLTIVSADATSYQLKATPVSGSPQATDGAIFYFSDGRKGWDVNNNGSLAAGEYCWSC